MNMLERQLEKYIFLLWIIFQVEVRDKWESALAVRNTFQQRLSKYKEITKKTDTQNAGRSGIRMQGIWKLNTSGYQLDMQMTGKKWVSGLKFGGGVTVWHMIKTFLS